MKILKALLLSVVVALGMGPAYAHESHGAIVIHGADGLSIVFFAFDGLYFGDCTEVVTPSGQHTFGCHAVLWDGEPVEKRQRLEDFSVRVEFGFVSCDVVVTPSGHANVVKCEPYDPPLLGVTI